MPGAQLISLQQANDHLRLDLDTGSGSGQPGEHADLELKMFIAEEHVLRYIGRGLDTGWTLSTVPPEIQGAILLELAHLWENRGEDGSSDPLSPAARSLLKLFRDPILY